MTTPMGTTGPAELPEPACPQCGYPGPHLVFPANTGEHDPVPIYECGNSECYAEFTTDEEGAA